MYLDEKKEFPNLFSEKLDPPANPNAHHAAAQKLIRTFHPDRKELLLNFPVDDGFQESKDKGLRPRREITTEDPGKFVDMYKHVNAVERRTKGEDVPQQELRYRKRQGRKVISVTCKGTVACKFTLKQLQNPKKMKQKNAN